LKSSPMKELQQIVCDNSPINIPGVFKGGLNTAKIMFQNKETEIRM